MSNNQDKIVSAEFDAEVDMVTDMFPGLTAGDWGQGMQTKANIAHVP